MIDHISIAVRDLKAAERFYAALLAPLGMSAARMAGCAVGLVRNIPNSGSIAERTWRACRRQGARLPRASEATAVDAFHAAGVPATASDGARAFARSTITLRRLHP